MDVTHVAAGEIGAVVRLQAHRRVDVVSIVGPSRERVRRIEAVMVVGRGEGAVGEDIRPGLVGDHAVGPQELECSLIVHEVVKQRVAELVNQATYKNEKIASSDRRGHACSERERQADDDETCMHPSRRCLGG